MSVIKSLIVTIVALAFVTSGYAQVTNYWVNNGGYTGTFNDGSASSHWDPTPGGPGGGAAPTTNDIVTFDNNQTSPYTVSFSGDIQSSTFNVRTDNVLFDLAGSTWTTRLDGFGSPPFNYGDGSRIGVGSSVTGAVTVSSSTTGANLVRDFISLSDYSYYALLVGNGAGSLGTLTIDDSLGNAATVWHRGNLFVGEGYSGGIGVMTISGAGSLFKSDYGGQININGGGYLYVTNGGTFDIVGGGSFNTAQSPGIAYLTVATGGTINSGNGWYSVYDPSVMVITNGGTWNASNVQMGGYRFYSGDPMYVRMTIDGATSSYNAYNVALGYGQNGVDGNAQITVQNEGTLRIVNALVVNTNTPNMIAAGLPTNNVTLAGGNVVMGGPASTNGGLLQVNGILRGAGSISAAPGNAGNFLLDVGAHGELRPGDTSSTPAAGLLSINDGNLTTETGSKSYFDFEVGNYDQVKIANGDFTIDGDLVYSFLNSYNPQVGDLFYFVIADQINFNPASDNMVALMASKGWAPGSYDYGVVGWGNGQALQLAVPEPTMVSLLALGGFMLRRQFRKGFSRQFKTNAKAVLLLFVACTWVAHTSESATSSNYWQDVGGNFNGGYSDSAHWSDATVPSATDTYVFFTNNVSGPGHTVQLSAVSTSGVIRVTTDVIAFDLNGYKWWAPPVAATDYYAGDPSVSHFFAGGVGETASIKFSSSSAPAVSGGNTLDLGNGVYGSARFGNGTPASTITIDDSLGFGAKVVLPWNFYNYGANIIISGAGSELSQPTEIFDGWGGNILVKDGGLLNIHGSYSSTVFTDYNPGIPYSTTTVNNATLITDGTSAIVGYGTTSAMIITNNGLWRVGQGGFQTSYLRVWSGDPYLGKVIVTDNSTIDSMGDVTVGQLGGGYAHDLGSLEILNSSKLISSNGNVIVHADTFTTGGATYTNRLVLDNTSSILLGDATHNGTITNRGLFVAGGTIEGQGPGNFLLRNEGQLEVGAAVGILALENGDLDSAAGSKTLFDFEAGNYDQIVVHNGDFTIDGDLIYSFLNSYNPQAGDLFYFAFADQINFNPSSDNMVALMASKGWAPGSYEYGVVPFGSGQALQLAVPEPTTVSLLALGGWMLLRRRKS